MKGEKIKEIVYDWIETIVVAFILAILIMAFIVQTFWIPSGSMEPTLNINDRIIVNKLAYGIQNPLFEINRDPKIGFWFFSFPNPLYEKQFPLFNFKYFLKFWSEPKRFDIIVFKFPQPRGGEARKDLIKRIIGLPGESLALKNGNVYINGKLLPEKHLMYKDTSNFGPVKIGEDAYFMVGDNRPNSADSRFWGTLPKKEIIGPAIFRIWPLWKIGLIP